MHHMKTLSNLNCSKIQRFFETSTNIGTVLLCISLIRCFLLLTRALFVKYDNSNVYSWPKIFEAIFETIFEQYFGQRLSCVRQVLVVVYNWPTIFEAIFEIWAKFGTTLEQCLLCTPVAGCCLQLAQDIWNDTWNHFWAIFGTTLALYASCWVLFIW